MRISHTELELCAANPGAWLRQKMDKEGTGFRRGAHSILRDAIFKYHAQQQDKAAGLVYLEAAITNKKIVASTAADMRARYASYVSWCRDTGLTVAKHRLQLNYDLGNDVTLGGFVSRVDVVPDGYRGVLFRSAATSSPPSVRMALVQMALANKLQRPEYECAIGFQALDGSDLDVRIYPERLRRRAKEYGEGIALAIATAARRMGL